LLKLTEDEINEEMNQHFQTHKRNFKPPIIIKSSKRLTFPLKRMHATEYTRSRVALIGDSCHNCHPLAGQGVNMGLEDVISLINIIQLGVKSGTDIGNYHLLKKYEKEQFLKNEVKLNCLEGEKYI
jgi:2-polyprenyl-6-methoxyphenol hydroxylase-like FAD-dependent oxidoreductase